MPFILFERKAIDAEIQTDASPYEPSARPYKSLRLNSEQNSTYLTTDRKCFRVICRSSIEASGDQAVKAPVLNGTH